MTGLVWSLVSRVFVFVALGAVVRKVAPKGLEKAVEFLVRLLIYAVIPVFMFLSMWSSDFQGASWAKIMLVAVVVVLCGAVFAKTLSLLIKRDFSELCLPVIIMNSAYLAIPVNALLWGKQGMVYAIFYNIAVTMLNFTFGIWLVAKEKPLYEMASIPIIYATLAGIALNWLSVPIAPALVKVNSVTTAVTLPLMLAFVGYRLGGVKFRVMGEAFWGVVFRIAGGFAVAAAVVSLLGIRGVEKNVAIMSSSMPAAVFSYILTERYSRDAGFAAAAVFVGTIVSVLTIPLIAYLLL
ncbi:MAG: AEC family transporter [Endomicrobiales bacterium]|nr:AEC family transporter [Endomicrobiales bacterium]